jgi:hypothetical protein
MIFKNSVLYHQEISSALQNQSLNDIKKIAVYFRKHKEFASSIKRQRV